MRYRFVFMVMVMALTMGSVSGVVFSKPAQASNLSLVISTVQITGGVGRTNEDFVELYNPNSEPVNLNGYRLVKRTGNAQTDSSIKSWTADVFIPAHSFYLWANSGFTSISVIPDVTTSSTLSDNNGVALRFGAIDSGQLVDSLAWGTTANGFTNVVTTNPHAGECVSRSSLFELQGYGIVISNPRNSTTQFLPPVVDNPPTNPEPSGEVPVSDSPIPDNLPTNPDNPLPSEPLPPEQQVEPTPLPQDVPVNNPTPTQDPVSIDDSGTATDESSPQALTTVKITEILPNPDGSDTGKEIVELFNYGNSPVNLLDWSLDDVNGDQSLSSNALVLFNIDIAPNQYLAITIPQGKFSLNNSNGDVISLFNDKDKLIDTVTYSESAPVAKSYSLINDNQWKWTSLTLGQANTFTVEESILSEDVDSDQGLQDLLDEPVVTLEGLIITEVYPRPQKNNEAEFVELYNSNDIAIDLSKAIISIGSTKASLPNILLNGHSYIVLKGKDLPGKLNDQGKIVSILQKDGVVVSQVEYSKSDKGQSFSKFEDNFLWTLSVTPGQENKLSQPLIKSVQSAVKSVIKKTSVKKVTKKAVKKVVKKSSIKKPTTVKKTKSTVDSSSPNKSGGSKNDSKSAPSGNSEKDNPSDKKEKSSSTTGTVAIAFASLGAGGLAIYRFGMGGSLPF